MNSRRFIKDFLYDFVRREDTTRGNLWEALAL